jgi:hypothetical protein
MVKDQDLLFSWESRFEPQKHEILSRSFYRPGLMIQRSSLLFLTFTLHMIPTGITVPHGENRSPAD